MDFEGGIAEFEAVFGEVGEGFGRREAVGLVVTVVGAGVAGDAVLVAAEELVYGLVVELTGDVPEGDVDGCEADAGDLAEGASDFGVDELALEGAAADEEVDEGGEGGVFGAAAAGVLADDALVGLDAKDAALGLGYGCRARRRG